MVKPLFLFPAFGLGGGWEWIVILIVAVLLFGSRLPSIARSLGKSMSEFKRGLRDVQNDIDQAGEDEIATDKSTEKNDSDKPA